MKFVKKTVLHNFDPLSKLKSQSLKERGENIILQLGKVYNDKGEIILGNSNVQNSDISELIKYFLENPKTSAPPNGYPEFLVLMNDNGLFSLKPPGILAKETKDDLKWISFK